MSERYCWTRKEGGDFEYGEFKDLVSASISGAPIFGIECNGKRYLFDRILDRAGLCPFRFYDTNITSSGHLTV